PADLAGVDAVIHLAGANVGERWTEAHKREILRSRELGTRTLVKALTTTGTSIRTLISGSATGYYGDTGSKLIDEQSPNGNTYLAEVCRRWEDESRPAVDAGIRVAIARTGIVLSPSGGALAKMLTPFRLGVGGPIGSGEQWMSWISLDDEVRALHFLLMDEACSGIYNLTAPEPITNTGFTHTLGDVLNRPALLPLPGFALKALFGEMAEETVLQGTRVVPNRLLQAGFRFRHPNLKAALQFELGR
ncbi:MAG TPA: TIGR01777 family oxidoreductase, partial [Gemmatimonadaceae bacterium]|nr:TIGR01777 family oxidoreductase [Gemmatimonadaceae bacterium]